MKNILYGDGIHDDCPAIQEMLDSGASLVSLPVPDKNYAIASPLRLHSNQELRLDRYTRVCLTDNANCAMIENAEKESGNQNITISGGIWDMNHNNQYPNPWHFGNRELGMTGHEWMEKHFDHNAKVMPDIYTGFCFIFNNINGLKVSDMTITNPVVYGMDLSYVEDFTVENITFDYTEGSPKLWNMDGVHIDGGCKNGVVRNLKGACHDDMVAITSDDFLYGPIENISVDGVFAENSHSAVRLLSRANCVKNININNIYGTFYVYAVVMSKYRETDDRSNFHNINISNVYASMCPGTVDVAGNDVPFIYIGDNMTVKRLALSNIYRDETHCTQPTIGIKEGTHIGELYVSCAEQTNKTGMPISFIDNAGTVDNLTLIRVDANGDELITGSGEIKNLTRI